MDFVENNPNGSIGSDQVTVSEKGVSESTQNSNCHFNWDAIDKVEYNESYLFIYNTPATAFVIPKGSQAKRFSGI